MNFSLTGTSWPQRGKAARLYTSPDRRSNKIELAHGCTHNLWVLSASGRTDQLRNDGHAYRARKRKRAPRLHCKHKYEIAQNTTHHHPATPNQQNGTFARRNRSSSAPLPKNSYYMATVTVYITIKYSLKLTTNFPLIFKYMTLHKNHGY